MNDLKKHRAENVAAFFMPLFLFFFFFVFLPLLFREKLMLPPAGEFFAKVRETIVSGELWEHLRMTLKRFSLALLLGSFFGVLTVFLVSQSRKARMLLEPLIYFLYPIPRFALFPFLILLFGTGLGAHVAAIGMGAFFPVVINGLSGFEHISQNYLEVARHYGAGGWKLYKRVVFPSSLPSLFSGLRIGVGLTLNYTLIVEFLMANTGVGAMMWWSYQTLRVDKLLLGAFVVAILNIFFIFLLKVLERFFIPWESL